MYNFLNRMARFVSILSGFMISQYLLIIMGAAYYEGMGVAGIFLGGIFGVIFKTAVFPAYLIEEMIDKLKIRNVQDKKNFDLKKKEITSNEILEKIDEKPESELVKDNGWKTEKESFAGLTGTTLEKSVGFESRKVINEAKFEKTIEPKSKTVNKVREPNIVENFFAENTFLKVLLVIGALLIFLAVVFFLKLLYTFIGPVFKLIIGFVVGFACYGVGAILFKNNYKSQGRVLLGVGILINFLVILGGRYLLEGKGSVAFLNEGVTFFFLILNTIFAVVTSLNYKSKALLIISFAFAYINPFLVGAKSDAPYTLIGYGFIVSIGAFVLSYLKVLKRFDEKYLVNFLLFTAIIGGNLLFLAAPFGHIVGWASKLIFAAIVSIIAIILSFKIGKKENLPILFGIAYFTLIILLISASVVLEGLFVGGAVYFIYVLYLLVFFALTIAMFMLTSIVYLLFALIFPFVIVIGLLYTGSLTLLIPTLLGCFVAFIIAFMLLFDKLANVARYLFFGLFAIFMVLVNGYLDASPAIYLDITTFVLVVTITLIFMGLAYGYSNKKGLENLYSIATLGSIFMLLPIIKNNGEMMIWSIFAIVGFGLLNIVLPFINANIRKSDIRNLIIGMIFGLLFIAGELYYFGDLYFPGVSLGLAFGGLAILYFVMGLGMMNIMGVSLSSDLDEKTKSEKSFAIKKNVILSYLAISLSLFSLAVALVFSNHGEIISVIWLFEATVLFWFFSKTKDIKIYAGALILFFIGIANTVGLIDIVGKGDFVTYVPIIIMFVYFVLNLIFLKDYKDNKRILHDILHLIGIFSLGAMILRIIPVDSYYGYDYFALAVYFVSLAIVYTLFANKFIKIAYVCFLSFMMFIHITELGRIFYKLEQKHIEILKLLQYATVILFTLSGYIFRKLSKSQKFMGLVKYITLIYFFIASSIIVYNISSNTFILTLYWGIFGIVYLMIGIHLNIKNFRTIGLYVTILVMGKIGLDTMILDNAVSRVLVFFFLGVAMIYISLLYHKKFGDNIKGEFMLDVDLPENNDEDGDYQDLNDYNSEENSGNNDLVDFNQNEEKENFQINDSIDLNNVLKDVDIGFIEGVEFQLKSGEVVRSKMKSLIQIVKYVVDALDVDEFEENQLNDVYEYIIANYKPSVSKAKYSKIKNIIKKFVEKGGKLVFKYKY